MDLDYLGEVLLVLALINMGFLAFAVWGWLVEDVILKSVTKLFNKMKKKGDGH